MEDLSEKAIIQNCPHCDLSSQAFRYPLLETQNFFVVCDTHPIIEGHVLIIPKQHISCMAEYPENIFREFLDLYHKFSDFLKETYKKVSTFEHGKFGQTVFHSHVHLLPFNGKPEEIISEGKEYITKINNLTELKKYFDKDNGYLFFSIENTTWTVDTTLAAPRFFRDRFAIALHRPERGNWKNMHNNEELMKIGKQENVTTQKQWKKYLEKNTSQNFNT